jgi:hypothetical protein
VTDQCHLLALLAHLSSDHSLWLMHNIIAALHMQAGWLHNKRGHGKASVASAARLKVLLNQYQANMPPSTRSTAAPPLT